MIKLLSDRMVIKIEPWQLKLLPIIFEWTYIEINAKKDKLLTLIEWTKRKDIVLVNQSDKREVYILIKKARQVTEIKKSFL